MIRIHHTNYSTLYLGMQPTPYGGHGYPGMMGGGMHGGGYGMGGSGGGRGGVVPFRAGDWKCGNEGCFYHNFAKNVSCLRCGASRNSAAIVAESNTPNMQNFGGPGAGYGGPPNMSMPQMDPSNYGGMGPGPGAYGGGAMGGPPGGFGQSFGPPSTYIPSGMGAPSPYMAAGYAQMAGSGGQAGGFDSRAEQAFNQGNVSATGGAPGYSNGGYGSGAAGGYGNDGAADPFSFLNAGMGNLGLSDNDRRNGQGQGGGAKSPQ